MINRVCIYVVYDKDGIVDDYIPYFLNALTPFVGKFVIVCNGKLNDEGREKLSRFTTELFVRPNEGYDAGAIKDALFNLYGWEKVLQFEELLICNDTFYGPLYPLGECFDKMDKQDVDFWGMSMHYKAVNKKTGIATPEHLQSFFLNVKKRLLISTDFQKFWEILQLPMTKYEAIFHYEFRFTTEFFKKGYLYAAYADSTYNSCNDLSMNYNHIICDAVESVERCKFPLIKKNAFKRQFADANMDKKRVSDLLATAKRLGYDKNLIIENLCRVVDTDDFTDTRLQPPEVWINFAKHCAKLYIYGAGEYAEMVANVFDENNIDYIGFIVSDNYPKHDTFHNHKCEYLSKVKFDDDTGVILGLDSKNRAEVEPLLLARGITNYVPV